MATQPQLALAEVVNYDVTETQIADLRSRFADVQFDTPERYEEGRKALATVRGLRTAIERRRKELKAEHLERGRKIDNVAKQLTALIEAIELPMLDRKATVDMAKEEAERAAREADLIAKEAALKAAQAAEDARIKVENERLAADRATFAEAQRKADEERKANEEADRLERERVAAQQREAQAKLDAERAALDARERAIEEQRQAVARAEEERLAAVRAEQEAIEQAERDRVAAEEARVRSEAEARRMEELRPELERAAEFGRRILALADDAPALTSMEAANRIDWACGRLRRIGDALTGRPSEPAATAPSLATVTPIIPDPSEGVIR